MRPRSSTRTYADADADRPRRSPVLQGPPHQAPPNHVHGRHDLRALGLVAPQVRVSGLGAETPDAAPWAVGVGRGGGGGRFGAGGGVSSSGSEISVTEKKKNNGVWAMGEGLGTNDPAVWRAELFSPWAESWAEKKQRPKMDAEQNQERMVWRMFNIYSSRFERCLFRSFHFHSCFRSKRAVSALRTSGKGGAVRTK